MKKTKRQLYILCDLEGASQISPKNKEAMHYGSALWHKEGRKYITSDVKAVCEAANEFGIDEIVINDEHDYGNREPNLLVAELPGNVKMVRRPHLPGTPRKMVQKDPFGMIIVGQHAMYGSGGFAAHTIQSPPIGCITLNGIKVGEIGLALALFMGVRFLAIVGEEAAANEARQLCPKVVPVPVKSLERDWFPTAEEMYPIIKEKITRALREGQNADCLQISPPYRFTLNPTDNCYFKINQLSIMHRLFRTYFARHYKGEINEKEAVWESKTITSGMFGIEFARSFIRKR